jgi:hypothetical protein
VAGADCIGVEGVGSVDGGIWKANGGGEFLGGRGWGTSRNTTVGEDGGGGGGGHDVGDGSEWLSVGGGASLLYIYTPFSPGSCNQP